MHDNQLTFAWRSPSNIAIVKYWGKHGDQLPDNPSLSITLSRAFTETTLVAKPLNADEAPGLTFRFAGKENPAFAQRVAAYVQRLSALAPGVKDFHLTIDTDNSFPHSSGIASSASAMSALALCIAELQASLNGHAHDERFQREVSVMARLGSGSACRSVYGPACLWGRTPMMPGSSDEYAIPLTNVHPVFQTLRDSILIISEEQKQVSSSAGHRLMQGHQFGSARIEQASQNLKMLLTALHDGDMATFGRIAEAEALALHALMMTSDPAYILIQPDTLQVIQRTKAFRESSGSPVYFTLDAGPNVHLLYPESHEAVVKAWINDDLLPFCKNGRVIHDQAGEGPRKIMNDD